LNPGEQHQAWYQQHEGEQSPVSSQAVSNSNSSQHAAKDKNGRNFSRPDLSVFPHFTEPFPYFRNNPDSGQNPGRKLSESEQK
jgi:hypothetical protein